MRSVPKVFKALPIIHDARSPALSKTADAIIEAGMKKENQLFGNDVWIHGFVRKGSLRQRTFMIENKLIMNPSTMDANKLFDEIRHSLRATCS